MPTATIHNLHMMHGQRLPHVQLHIADHHAATEACAHAKLSCAGEARRVPAIQAESKCPAKLCHAAQSKWELHTHEAYDLQEAYLRHCAEMAPCGGVTLLYGRLNAYMKHLHRVRNPVFSAWR